MKSEQITNFLIEKDYILNVHNNVAYNKIILDYYNRYQKEGNLVSKNKITSIERCNKFWYMDVYEHNSIKDYVSTSLCKDKFCNNCKKVKQACRMVRYIPDLEKYKNNLYHVTLTVPNVVGEELKIILEKMSKSFQKLIKFFRLNTKVSGIDFSKYGYKGAVRSLEITFKNNEYHPHYHVAFVFNNLELNKTIKNKYSIDLLGNRSDRLFSEFEILIQKIWYLCINDIQVTKENIDNLEIGYSCMCDKFIEDDYAELFKYMTKETDENKNVLTYENFKTLYESTYLLKQIQGYGCLYRITDNDLTEEIDKVYASIKEFLQTEEKPLYRAEQPFELLNNNNYKIISRKKIYSYLKELNEKPDS